MSLNPSPLIRAIPLTTHARQTRNRNTAAIRRIATRSQIHSTANSHASTPSTARSARGSPGLPLVETQRDSRTSGLDPPPTHVERGTQHRPKPAVHDSRVPHIVRKPGILGGTTLAVFMTLVHTVNDAITAIFGALLPTLQVRFEAGPMALALMIAVFWIASSVTQPVFGALGEDVGLRLIGCVGVLMASTFLSLIGVASELWLVFVLLVIGGLGSAALHPIGTTIAGSQATNATLGVGLFTAGGMVGFALGPVVILYVVSTYGIDATVLLAVPGLVLGAAVGLLLPRWEPHPRRPLRRLFDLRLARGPVGALAVASMFSALAFITFTGSIPLWLVHEHSYRPDAAVIGGDLPTLGVMSCPCRDPSCL